MSLMQSTIFYLIVLLICVFFSNLADKKNNKKILVFPILLLTLVCGLRSWYTGSDTYANYIGAEQSYNSVSIFNKVSYAPGYNLLVNIIYGIWHNYNFLLTIEAFITISLIFIRFWDFRDKGSYKFMIFDFLMLWFIDMLTLKVQYIALAIAFFSTRYLKNNNKKDLIKYILLTFIASSIHISAFVNFLILIIYNIDFKNLTKRKLMDNILVIIFFTIIIIFAKDLFVDRYMKYYINRESHFGYMNIIRILMLLSTIIFSKSLLKDATFKKIFLITLIGFLGNFIGYFIGNAGRAIMYLTIYNCVIYGIVQKNGKIAKMYKLLITIYLILYEIYVISQSDINSEYLYNFFFNM